MLTIIAVAGIFLILAGERKIKTRAELSRVAPSARTALDVLIERFLRDELDLIDFLLAADELTPHDAFELAPQPLSYRPGPAPRALIPSYVTNDYALAASALEHRIAALRTGLDNAPPGTWISSTAQMTEDERFRIPFDEIRQARDSSSMGTE